MIFSIIIIFQLFVIINSQCQSQSGDCISPCPTEASGNNSGYFVSWLGWNRQLRRSIKEIQREMRLYNKSAIIKYQNRWQAHVSFHYFCCHSLSEEILIKHNLKSYLNRTGLGQQLLTSPQLGCNYRTNEFNQTEAMLHLIFDHQSRKLGDSIALTIENIIQTKTNVPIWNPWLTNCPQLHITVGAINPNYFPLELFLATTRVNPILIRLTNYILSGSQWQASQLFL